MYMELLSPSMEETQPNSSIRLVIFFSSINNLVHIVNFQGFGTLLMEEAERIAREEHDSVKLAVISGMSLLRLSLHH